MARKDDIEEIQPDLNGKGLRIGIVMSRFNQDVSEGLLSACTAALVNHGVREPDMLIVTVPGALEVALVLQKLAQSGKYHALIALGAVIRGDTYHFEIVSNESAAGVTQVQLDAGMPVANGILTTDTEEQALARVRQKGGDCAEAAVEMANLAREIRNEKRSA